MRVLSDLTKDDCPYLRLVSFKNRVPIKVEFVQKGKTYTTYNVDAQAVSDCIARMEEECKSLPNYRTTLNMVATLNTLKGLLPTP